MIFSCFFFFQAEDGIRDLVRSRGLGDVYKRQVTYYLLEHNIDFKEGYELENALTQINIRQTVTSDGLQTCLLYTSDAADERSSVDLGGRRIIKKKNNRDIIVILNIHIQTNKKTNKRKNNKK